MAEAERTPWCQYVAIHEVVSENEGLYGVYLLVMAGACA